MHGNKKHKPIELVSALLLALMVLLGACGDSSNQNRRVITVEPPVSAAVQLPASTVSTGNTRAEGSLADATSTPVVAPTPTLSQQNYIVSSSPTPAPVSPTPKATATPTPRANAEKIDQAAELKTIKTAYEAINKHLFREPDTRALLTASLEETATILGVKAPAVTFERDQEANWNRFNEAFTKLMAAAPEFKYPRFQLAHRVVKVMAQAVGDEHTYFLDTFGFQSRQNLLSGNNTSIGFGVVVTTQEDKAYIVRVVAGGPADQAGVKPGDQMLEYDGLQITDKNWSTIRNAKENETHRFVLNRLGAPQPVILNITKRKYNLPTVEYRLINNRIGYIAIRDFFLNVADETDLAMAELRKQGADSWIIDLRENPGGVNVEQVTGRFVAGGEIMGYNIDRNSRQPMKVSNDLSSGPNKGKPFSPLLPMVVLIDEVSASSSEMLALAVRDFKLGPLIGAKTAGALGHTAAYPLGEGTAISVTVDEYESRGGEKVNGSGIVPDIMVERTMVDLVSGRDPQLKAGVEYLEKLLAKK